MRLPIILGAALVALGIFTACTQAASKTENPVNNADNKIQFKPIITETKKSGLPENPNDKIDYSKADLKEIYLAGGCFWGLEAYLERVYGVADAVSGYANGNTKNPKYEDLIYNGSGHAETVKVVYDPSKVTLETLLSYYLKVVDPTSLNKQGNDRGTQYRSGIYF